METTQCAGVREPTPARSVWLSTHRVSLADIAEHDHGSGEICMPREAAHVASMSRGVTGSQWEPLKYKEKILQHEQHGNGAQRRFAFRILLLFQCDGTGRTRTYEGIASGF